MRGRAHPQPLPPLQDFEGELKTISFSKNGTVFGTAFVLSDDALKGVALFPHVMTKNIRVTVNFGGKVGHAYVVATPTLFATPHYSPPHVFCLLGLQCQWWLRMRWTSYVHRPIFGHDCLSLRRHLPLIPQRGIPPSSKLIRIILSRPKVSQHKHGNSYCCICYHGETRAHGVKRHVFSFPLSHWKPVPSQKRSVK